MTKKIILALKLLVLTAFDVLSSVIYSAELDSAWSALTEYQELAQRKSNYIVILAKVSCHVGHKELC